MDQGLTVLYNYGIYNDMLPNASFIVSLQLLVIIHKTANMWLK